jgi:NTP pyrophosphatase (non-canonical NTP hydrolase)
MASFRFVQIFRKGEKAFFTQAKTSPTMTDIKEIIQALISFRDERDWKQFHDPKNLATAISIEAAELNELFLWKSIAESENVDANKVKEELADVLAFALLLAERYGFDVKEIVLEKIKKNGEKYPVEKAKGNASKYTEL